MIGSKNSAYASAQNAALNQAMSRPQPQTDGMPAGYPQAVPEPRKLMQGIDRLSNLVHGYGVEVLGMAEMLADQLCGAVPSKGDSVGLDAPPPVGSVDALHLAVDDGEELMARIRSALNRALAHHG